MNWHRTVAGSVVMLLGVFTLSVSQTHTARAQTAEASLKQSCGDATRAFALRDAGDDGLIVADPAATGKLRQAALLFYRCSQRETDPYMRELFQAYYADSLYKVARNANDPRAAALASKAAQPLSSSEFDDVKALIANVPVPSTAHRASPQTPAPVAATHSEAYCQEFVPSVARSLDALGAALIAANDAGTNDTQVLATTTARYGGAFKAVEDDYKTVQSNLQTAASELTSANAATGNLTDQEKRAVMPAADTIAQSISYTEIYSRLALLYERGINGANRRLAWARVSQAFAAGMQNRSYTYSNGNASCYSYTTYSANCYGNTYSTTTYDNSATIAQQNAANALANAQAGRLSFGQADQVLSQGLPVIQQAETAVYSAAALWTKACAPTQ